MDNPKTGSMGEEEKSCCDESCNCSERSSEKRGLMSGIIYGLVPHTGCIAFILFAVLGVTAATTALKPLMLNPYFFYILIALSLVFATASAAFYLNRCGLLSASGIRKRWKYLSLLYGTTMAINLALFMVVFPYATNLMSKPALAVDISPDKASSLTLKVDIPCPGHAPLITTELNKIDGVAEVNFRFPNVFAVSYDSAKASKEQILNLDVFNTYKATVVE